MRSSVGSFVADAAGDLKKKIKEKQKSIMGASPSREDSWNRLKTFQAFFLGFFLVFSLIISSFLFAMITQKHSTEWVRNVKWMNVIYMVSVIVTLGLYISTWTNSLRTKYAGHISRFVAAAGAAKGGGGESDLPATTASSNYADMDH